MHTHQCLDRHRERSAAHSLFPFALFTLLSQHFDSKAAWTVLKSRVEAGVGVGTGTDENSQYFISQLLKRHRGQYKFKYGMMCVTLHCFSPSILQGMPQRAPWLTAPDFRIFKDFSLMSALASVTSLCRVVGSACAMGVKSIGNNRSDGAFAYKEILQLWMQGVKLKTVLRHFWKASIPSLLHLSPSLWWLTLSCDYVHSY